MDAEIIVTSTTDPQEVVDQVAGVEPPKPEETKPEEVLPVETKPEVTDEKAKGEKIRGRIDKLTAEVYDLREKLAAATRPAEEAKAAADAADPEPKVEQFGTYEQYVKAQARWEARQEIKSQQAKEVEQAQQEHTETVFAAYNKQIAAAREKYDDFDETLSANIPIPQGVQLAIYEMENGGEVGYYLGKHPELCEQMMEMSPLQAIMAAGRLSTELAPPASEKKPAVKPTSKAPEPPKPVGGGSTKSTVALDELPYQEYRKAREEQTRGRMH